MFKDYEKYLSISLKVYSFVLLLILILKIVGFNYFGMDVNNSTLTKLNDFITSYHLENVWYAISLYINIYIVVSVTTNEDSLKLKLFVLCLMPLIIAKEVFQNDNLIYLFIDFIYMLLIAILYLRKSFKIVNLKNYILFYIINLLLQIFSMFIRGKSIEILMDNFVLNFIYNLDYFIMMIIFHHLYFKKGVNDLCTKVVSYSSQRLILLKKSLTKLRKKSQNKQKKKTEKTKQEKISDIIYTILYLIWNLFTLFLIIIVALINDKIIECIFIVFAFWTTKTVFGKAFHFNSVLTCFIVSNLTYYLLSKITTPLGISILIPIMLGVGLSYFTSKFVKKTYKPLYRGMPVELFDETILHVVDKNSTKYNICYDFYINSESDLSLSFKYNYSVAGIRKIKDRVNYKIKEL